MPPFSLGDHQKLAIPYLERGSLIDMDLLDHQKTPADITQR